MKKLIALMIAMLLALMMLTPALAEKVDDSQDTGEVTETVVAEAEDGIEATEEVKEEAEDAVEEVAEEEAPAHSPIIKKLFEVPWYTWAVIAALVVAAVVLAVGSKNIKWDSRRLAMGAMCIAIAFVLSCIRLFRMPQGGSITPASMLPLVLFMVAAGPLQGFVVGCAYGLLQLITDPYVIHPIQLLVDYPLAYGAMILGCLAMLLPFKKQWKLPIAVLLAGIGRYIMAVLSGTIFFGEYAPEGQTALVYSLVYNISYLGPDTLVCMVVACIPGMSRLVDMIKKRS